MVFYLYSLTGCSAFFILQALLYLLAFFLLEDSYFLAILACNLFSYTTTPKSVSSISGHASRAPVAKADDWASDVHGRWWPVFQPFSCEVRGRPSENGAATSVIWNKHGFENQVQSCEEFERSTTQVWIGVLPLIWGFNFVSFNFHGTKFQFWFRAMLVYVGFRFFRGLSSRSLALSEKSSRSARSSAPSTEGSAANGGGAVGQSSTRSFFRSLNFKSHDGQTKSGTSDLLKVNFTLESLLDFQRSHHTHAVVGCGFEKVPGDVSLGHHKRPNYNNQQRRLLAKGRQHSEQLVSN